LFFLQAAGAARCAFPEFFGVRQNSRNCSNDAGPKERAAIYRAALRSVCQCQNVRFHRFFAVFPGISLENPVFPGISGVQGAAGGRFMRVKPAFANGPRT
jgi:hypothetical protein